MHSTWRIQCHADGCLQVAFIAANSVLPKINPQVLENTTAILAFKQFHSIFLPQVDYNDHSRLHQAAIWQVSGLLNAGITTEPLQIPVALQYIKGRLPRVP